MTPNEELDRLMNQCKEQAKVCAKHAVRFRKAFKFLAWTGMFFACIFFPLGGFILAVGVHIGSWRSIAGGVITIGIAVFEAYNTPRRFHHSDETFHEFMRLREISLTNLKEIQEFKKQFGKGEEWHDG